MHVITGAPWFCEQRATSSRSKLFSVEDIAHSDIYSTSAWVPQRGGTQSTRIPSDQASQEENTNRPHVVLYCSL